MGTKKDTRKKQDMSKNVPQNPKLKEKLEIKIRTDLTEKQMELIKVLTDKNTKIVFLIGPAGTSKTFSSILAALMLLNEKKVSDIYYVRAAVESADNKLGFLPGEADEKMSPYIQPLLDKLDELLSKAEVDKLKKEKRINGIPINYLRGLNWNSKVVISDECQNMSKKELVTLVTRIGEFSKLFICADPDQSDINGKSGLLPMAELFDDEESKQNGIHIFRFNEEDVVRSGLCRYLLKKLKGFI